MNVKKSVILAFLVAVGILLQLLESFVGIFMIVQDIRLVLRILQGCLHFIYMMKNHWLMFLYFAFFYQV